ncbi:hypothetical protein [Solimonas sp. SE-A11]|uniref:DUF7940 domain-containing protein n=1 Tax=Solimonas sp. SE-A11 TaxID=3054954 RepID=UPI00259C8227|nr:hypothetical protein [Solimonas sp. SE-A11]MDM4768635.1 hypothetical protein [Solimonas sp. SE-A11]
MPSIKKPSLVPDWRECYRWFCMHAMLLSIALQGAWLELPDSMKADVPGWLVHAVTIAVLVLGMVGRVVDQVKPTPPEPPQ